LPEGNRPESASIPRTSQLGHAQNLIALLDNADEESGDADEVVHDQSDVDLDADVQ